MADSLCSPCSGNVGLGLDEDSFVTPPASQDILEFSTPKLSAVKRIAELKGACKSPALRVPASPLMKRLGFGTGKQFLISLLLFGVQCSVKFCTGLQVLVCTFWKDRRNLRVKSGHLGPSRKL